MPKTKQDRLASYREFDWSGWTDWQPVPGLDLSDVPCSPGAYAISTGTTIQRAVGADHLGLLDIGEAGRGSSTLRGRLEKFRICATNRGAEGHMAGWRYSFFHFDRHFPWTKLRVRWCATSTKEDAYALEGRLLLTYVLRHSELPPLNYKFNWSAFEDLGWDAFDDPAVLVMPGQSES